MTAQQNRLRLLQRCTKPIPFKWSVSKTVRGGVFIAVCGSYIVSFDGTTACCIPLNAQGKALLNDMEIVQYDHSMSKSGKSAAFRTLQIPFQKSSFEIKMDCITYLM
jgi:hypothetical protein